MGTKGSAKSVLTAALFALAVTGCATRPAPEPEPTGPTQEELDRQRAEAAAQAEREANERALREAREMLRQAREYTNLNADQQNRLRQAEQAINANEGRRAHDLLSRLLSELRAARSTYRVVSGDSLWRIAGRSEVYGNPYQWPLIYRENADKIRDADLIHPNQEFQIVTHPRRGDADRAVEHARTRGAWAIGRVEESDRRDLGR
jgi:nucleoid-associated protein YgaU